MKEPARRRMLCWALLLVAVALGGATMLEWKEAPFALGRRIGQSEIAEASNGERLPQGSAEVLEASLVPPKERLRTGVERWVFRDGDQKEYVETFFGWSLEEQRVMAGSSLDGVEVLHLPDGSEERILPAEGEGMLVSIYSIEQAEWIRQSLAKRDSLSPMERKDLILSSRQAEEVDDLIRVRMMPVNDSQGIEMEIQFDGQREGNTGTTQVSLQDGQSLAYTVRRSGSGEFTLYLFEATLTH